MSAGRFLNTPLGNGEDKVNTGRGDTVGPFLGIQAHQLQLSGFFQTPYISRFCRRARAYAAGADTADTDMSRTGSSSKIDLLAIVLQSPLAVITSHT